MQVENQKILDAIESSLYLMEGVEGVFKRYIHPSLKGYIWKDLDFEEYNQVGKVRLTKDKVDGTISEVINTYSSLGLTKIGWFISPQSTPKNLPEVLKQYGFSKKETIWGMVRPTDEPMDFSISEEFDFKEYRGAEEILPLYDNPVNLRNMEISYGMPEGSADILKIGAVGLMQLDNTVYLAFDKITNEMIAFGGLTYIPHTTMGLLSGAATMPEYRNRGIYSSMLKLRFERAKSDNISHLIIQAKEHTSAPIAAKSGFEKVCEIPFYVWNKNK